jgi:pyruvate dehydrogenase (quinone)
MAKTVSELLIDRLVDWGVDTIFGFPGDGINGFFEGLRNNQKKMRFIQVRHEEAAAFAACGHAKYTGKIGVCVATSGPGGIHLLNGLYDAKFDGQPVLAITGHTFHDLIGTHFQQDLDLDKVFADVAVYNERLMGATHVHNVVDAAIRTALYQRGVAHINIPKDIQDWTTSETPRSSMNIANHSQEVDMETLPLPARGQIQAAADILNQGKKVAILAGQGCLHARKELIEVAEKLGAPVVKALLGKAVLPDDHPLTTGGLGLLGTAPSQDVMNECDTLLIAGSSFPYMQFLPKPGQAKGVQIDIDGSRLGLRYPAEVGLIGDCRRVLQALAPLLQPKKDRSFLEMAQKNMKEWNDLMVERGTREDKPIKPQVIAHRLNDFLTDDAIIACDCGTITTWAARQIHMRERMMFSVSGTHATMGNGIPYAIAAQLAYPDRQVVAVMGDGGTTMLLGELATLVKYKLPVKVIVFKNNTLGQIKWEQLVMEGNPHFGTELQPIDFATIAKGFGLAGFTLEGPKGVKDVLTKAFTHNGPALVEAVIDPHEPPMPGHATTKQAFGFAKALARGDKDRFEIIKTVLKDVVREVV